MRQLLTLTKLAFLLCLSTRAAFSQVVSADSLTDSNLMNITRYVGISKTTSLIRIDSVVATAFQSRFSRAPNKQIVFAGYDSYYYWFKIIVRNDDSAGKDLRLLMPPVGMRKGELFQRDILGWKPVAVTGYSIPFNKRPYLYAHYIFPFSIKKRTIDTLYLRMDASHAFKSYGFALMKPKALKMLENKVYFLLGIIVGILVLFGLFNLYLFFSLKERIHLWYSLHILLLLLIAIKNEQLDQEFLGWDNETAYRMTSIMGIGAVAMAILIQVILHFLTDVKKHRFLLRLTLFVKWNVFISGLLQLIIFYADANADLQSWVYFWCNKSTVLAVGVIMLDCIYGIYKDRKNAFFLAAILVFLVGALFRLLLIGIKAYFQPPHPFHYGMVLETFIITFGLIYRYRLERNQRIRYLKEKETLENNREKLLLESKVEIQQQTLRTTFKEINTNIGQKIMLVKENLRHIQGAQQESLSRWLNESNNLLSKAIGDLRNVCKTLDTDYVRDIGLLKSIEYDLEQCKSSGACNTTFQTQGSFYKMDPQKELVLFRIYQEVLNNMNKYVGGGQISVIVRYERTLLKLMISWLSTDPAMFRAHDGNPENDLAYGELQKRINLIGGSLNISRHKGSFTIIAALPKQETGSTAFA